jgi:hypothetical protein
MSMSKSRNVVSTTTLNSGIERPMDNLILYPITNEDALHSDDHFESRDSILAEQGLASATAIPHLDTATGSLAADGKEFQPLIERYLKSVTYLPQKVQIHRIEQDIATQNVQLQQSLSVIALATLEIVSFQAQQLVLSEGIDSILPKLLTEEERIKARLERSKQFSQASEAISTYNDALELTLEKGGVLRNALEFSMLDQDIKERKDRIEVEKGKTARARMEISKAKSISLSHKAEISKEVHSSLQIDTNSAADMRALFECVITVFFNKIVAMMNLLDSLPESEPPSSLIEYRHKRKLSSLDSMRCDFLRRHIERDYKEAQKREEDQANEIANLKQQLRNSRQEMKGRLDEQEAAHKRENDGLKSLLLDVKTILANRGILLDDAKEDIAQLKNRVSEMKPLYMVGYKVRAHRIVTLRAGKLGVSADSNIVEAGQKACLAADAVADSLVILHRTSTPTTQQVSEYGATYGEFDPGYIRNMDNSNQSMLIDVTNWWSDMNTWYHLDTISVESFNTSRLTFAVALRRYPSAVQNNNCIRDNRDLLGEYRLMKRKQQHATTMWRKLSIGEVREMKINKKQDREHWKKKLKEKERKLLQARNEHNEEYDDDGIDDGSLEFFKSEKQGQNHNGMLAYGL